MCFAMRLLHAELPLLCGRSQETLDRLYYMLAVCTRVSDCVEVVIYFQLVFNFQGSVPYHNGSFMDLNLPGASDYLAHFILIINISFNGENVLITVPLVAAS